MSNATVISEHCKDSAKNTNAVLSDLDKSSMKFRRDPASVVLYRDEIFYELAQVLIHHKIPIASIAGKGLTGAEASYVQPLLFNYCTYFEHEYKQLTLSFSKKKDGCMSSIYRMVRDESISSFWYKCFNGGILLEHGCWEKEKDDVKCRELDEYNTCYYGLAAAAWFSAYDGKMGCDAERALYEIKYNMRLVDVHSDANRWPVFIFMSRVWKDLCACANKWFQRLWPGDDETLYHLILVIGGALIELGCWVLRTKHLRAGLNGDAV